MEDDYIIIYEQAIVGEIYIKDYMGQLDIFQILPTKRYKIEEMI